LLLRGLVLLFFVLLFFGLLRDLRRLLSGGGLLLGLSLVHLLLIPGIAMAGSGGQPKGRVQPVEPRVGVVSYCWHDEFLLIPSPRSQRKLGPLGGRVGVGVNSPP
jgi:hypothetical protein